MIGWKTALLKIISQGEINNYNEEIEDNQEKVGAIAVEEQRAEEMSDQCETVDMATLEGWDIPRKRKKYSE